MDEKECARCHEPVWIPDGYDWNEGDMCMTCSYERIAELEQQLAEARKGMKEGVCVKN